MKMNLKKTLVATTILSTSVATIGLSLFIVGGYGNNIDSLPEIQNSGFFGLNTAFAKERTTTYDTKEKYVEYLTANLEIEAAKVNSIEYKLLEKEINDAQGVIFTTQANEIEPLKEAVRIAKENFEKNRTAENKEKLHIAEQTLIDSPANDIIAANEAIIKQNNEVITKIKQSKEDISRLSNYSTWNALFITGSSLLAIGSILTIASTSYSIFLRKKEKKTTE